MMQMSPIEKSPNHVEQRKKFDEVIQDSQLSAAQYVSAERIALESLASSASIAALPAGGDEPYCTATAITTAITTAIPVVVSSPKGAASSVATPHRSSTPWDARNGGGSNDNVVVNSIFSPVPAQRRMTARAKKADLVNAAPVAALPLWQSLLGFIVMLVFGGGCTATARNEVRRMMIHLSRDSCAVLTLNVTIVRRASS